MTTRLKNSKYGDSSRQYTKKEDNIDMKSTKSSRSRRSDAFSDVEDNDSILEKSIRSSRRQSTSRMSHSESTTNKLKETIDKLLQDKDRLKATINQYSFDMKSIEDEHAIELANVERYFQEQLNALKEEKEEAIEQISFFQETLHAEKDKLRRKYVAKLDEEKRKSDARNTASTSTQLSRMTSTIEKLQENLDRKIEDNDRLENKILEIENSYRDQTEKLCESHRKHTEELDNKIRENKDIVESERVELRRLASTYEQEKECFKRECLREREVAIENVNIDKKNVVRTLEGIISSNEKTIETMKKEHAKEISQIKLENQISITEKDSYIEIIKTEHEDQLKTLECDTNSKLKSMSNKHKLEKEMDNKDRDERISEIEHRHKVELEKINYEMTEKIATLELNLEKEKGLVEKIRTENVKNLERQINDIELKNVNEMHGLSNKITRMTYDNEKMIMEIKLQHEKEIRELESINHNIDNKSSQYKDTIELLKENAEKMKTQYLEDLNKQKDKNETLSTEYDEKIEQMEVKMREMHENYLTKLNISRASENESKRLLYDTKSERDEAVSELEKARDNITRVESQNKIIEHKYEDRIERLKNDFMQKMKTVTNDATGKISPLLEKSQRDCEYYKKLSNSLKEEMTSRIDLEREKVRIETSKDLSEMQDTIDKAQTKIDELIMHISCEKTNSEEELNKVLNERDSLRQEIGVMKKYADEVTSYKVRNDHLENEIRKMSEITAERIRNNEDELASNMKSFASRRDKEVNDIKEIMHKDRLSYTAHIESISEKATKDLNELQKLKGVLEEKENHLSTVRETSVELKQQIAELKNDISDYKKVIKCNEEVITRTKRELDELVNNPVVDHSAETKMRKLRDECLTSIRKQKLELSHIKDENVRLRSNIDKMKTDLNIKTVECDRYKNESSNIKEFYSDINNKIKTLEDANETLKENNGELQNKLNVLEMKSDSDSQEMSKTKQLLEESDGKLKTLENTNELLRDNNGELQNKLNVLEMKSVTDSQEMSKTKQLLEESDGKLKTLENTNELLKENNGELQNKLNVLEMKSATESQEMSKTKQLLKEIDYKVKTLEDANETLRENSSELKSTIKVLEIKSDSATKEMCKTKHLLEESDGKLKTLENTNELMKENNGELQNKLNVLEMKSVTDSQEVSKTKQLLEESDGKLKTLEDENETLKENNDKLISNILILEMKCDNDNILQDTNKKYYQDALKTQKEVNEKMLNEKSDMIANKDARISELETILAGTIELSAKEDALNKQKEELEILINRPEKDIAIKLLEDKVKKTRDDALVTVRNYKKDLEASKAESESIREQLAKAELALSEKNK